MDYKKIKLRSEDGVAIVTLSDPATMNAAGSDTARELTDAFKRIASGEVAARAVVLTGEGRGFCSGANLAANPGGSPQGDGRPDAGAGLKAIYNPLMTLLRDFDLPIVTAVNGAAAGVGCSLALMGDIIVAGESAYFLQAFRRIGLVPDGGSTYLLPRLIGKARAMEMALLGEKVPARTALEWGLINRCVADDQLMPTALEIARELAKGPRSIGLIRKIMLTSLDADWADALENEADTQTVAGRTDDFREGVLAFLQKRPAQFQGR
jgi:2-(1,2-epoxy-1,2-dihydrophenyl)acetyl-CoA isomerase